MARARITEGGGWAVQRGPDWGYRPGEVVVYSGSIAIEFESNDVGELMAALAHEVAVSLNEETGREVVNEEEDEEVAPDPAWAHHAEEIARLARELGDEADRRNKAYFAESEAKYG